MASFSVFSQGQRRFRSSHQTWLDSVAKQRPCVAAPRMGLGSAQEASVMNKATSPAKRRPKKQVNPSTNQEDKAAAGNGESKEELVVFAFRLTAAERELLHKAAGPAKASK